MGEIRKYNCACGYEKELPIGVGMMGMNLMMIKRIFPKDALSDFLKEKENGHIESYISKNQLGLCTNCHSLIVSPHLQYTKQDGSEKHIMMPCPDCGEKFSPIDNPDDVHCPQCGKKMAYETAGNWD